MANASHPVYLQIATANYVMYEFDSYIDLEEMANNRRPLHSSGSTSNHVPTFVVLGPSIISKT